MGVIRARITYLTDPLYNLRIFGKSKT